MLRVIGYGMAMRRNVALYMKWKITHACVTVKGMAMRSNVFNLILNPSTL